MAKIKLLVKGYVNKKDGKLFASSNVSLIQTNKGNVLIDPGMDRASLCKAFENEEINIQDIDYVVVTHHHPDHSLLTGLFEKATIFDYKYIYTWNGCIKKHKGMIPTTSIRIIKTPGHTHDHCSVLIQTREFGKVAIVGDVFWWGDEEQQKIDVKSLLFHPDPYAENFHDLLESRSKILRIAEYIIPGHGDMFKVKK